MRPIDADALKEELSSLSVIITGLRSGKGVLSEFMEEYRKSILRSIDEQATIDPESLREQGEWVLGYVEPGHLTPGGNRPWICSECGQVKSWLMDRPTANYCPNCGERMKM